MPQSLSPVPDDEEIVATALAGTGTPVRFPLNGSGRDFVVGDIHGAFADLRTMLHELGFDERRDRLFSVGDLVDRGADSGVALEWVEDLPWFHAIRGNHEQLLLDSAVNDEGMETWMLNGGEWWHSQDADRQRRFREAFARLPFAMEIETESGLVGVIHGDIPSGWSWDEMCERLGDGDRVTVFQALWHRERSLDAMYGREAGDEPREPVEGRVNLIYCGHTPMKEPTASDNVRYIDTGAGMEQSLTVAQIHPGEHRTLTRRVTERIEPYIVHRPRPRLPRIPYDEETLAAKLAGTGAPPRFPVNASGRDFVVGDIRGHFTALRETLDGLGFDETRDRLFSAGCLTTPGPDSGQALEWIEDLPWFHAVRGGTEQNLLHLADSDRGIAHFMLRDGKWWQSQNADRQRRLLEAFARLPFAMEIETESGLVGVAHADIPLGWSWDEMCERLGNGDHEAAFYALWNNQRHLLMDQDLEPVAGRAALVYCGRAWVDEPVAVGNVRYLSVSLGTDESARPGLAIAQIHPGEHRILTRRGARRIPRHEPPQMHPPPLPDVPDDEGVLATALTGTGTPPRLPANGSGRDFVAGDIHGHFDRLREILDELGFDETRDRLFSVGDMVSPGADSGQALEWVEDLPWFHAIRGSSEQLLLDSSANDGCMERFMQNGGEWWRSQDADRQRRFREAFARLPFAMEIETGSGLVGVIHADVPIGWSWDEMCERLGNGDREAALYALRSHQRYDHRDHDPEPVEGRVRLVYCGHTQVEKPVFVGNVCYLNTGAGTGTSAYSRSRLTVARIHPGEHRAFSRFASS